jgi:hypothetical protein
MSNNFDNRMRAFAELVSIEAWHEDFTNENKRVALHADVTFGTARLGGEPEASVRFKLSLKRAELVVILSDREPAIVDPSSVARDWHGLTGTKSLRSKSLKSGITSIEATAGIGPEGLDARIGASAKGSIEGEYEEIVVASEDICRIKVCHAQSEGKDQKWSFEPDLEAVLKGKPWNANDMPILDIVDRRKDSSEGIAPVVTLELRCLREDLHIENIVVKNPNFWERVGPKWNNRNHVIAAEAFIRNKLAEHGLETVDLGDAYSRLVLGTVTASTLPSDARKK